MKRLVFAVSVLAAGLALSSSARGYELHRCEQSGVHGFVDMFRDPASAVIEAVRAVSRNQQASDCLQFGFSPQIDVVLN